MRAILRLAVLTLFLALFAPEVASAQNPPPRQQGTFTPGELVREGHHFFGTVSRGLAQIVETAVSRWGQPNGYVLGQEGSGAFMVGLRYGDGKLYTKNAGDRRVFWEDPSVGFDTGGERVQRKERSTLVFVREGGDWKIAHEHLSPIKP